MPKNEVDILIKARDQASKKLKHVGKSAQSMGKMLKIAAAGAATYFGFRAIKNFTAGSVKAFGVQETAIKHLQDALGTLGVSSKSAMQDMQNFASSIQSVTTVGDEVTLELMSLGATMGGLSGDSLKAATTAAIGFSRSLGVDTKTAMVMVAKAAQGNTTTFSRYGIQLDANMTKQEQFQAILARGNEGFKLAQGETDTFAGKMKQLSNTWGDFKEMIGGAIANWLPGLTENIKVVQVALENWRIVTDMAWTSAKLGLLSFWEDIKYFFGSTIPDLLGWFGRNWQQIFTDLWNGTKTIISNMSDNLINFFKEVWSWLKGEGFNFEWTGLLDGFESTLEEMPKIVQRHMSDTEKELKKQIADLKNQFGEKLSTKINAEFDTGKSLANATMPSATGAKTAMTKTATGPQNLAARESRFLTMSGSRVDKTEINTGKTVNLLAKNNQILEKMHAALSGKGAPATNLQLVPAGFS